MPNYNNIKELFTDICDSIRNKTGETGLINHTDIPEKIDNIQTGGGTGEAIGINSDYQGALMYKKNITDATSKLNEIATEINKSSDFFVLDELYSNNKTRLNIDFDFSLFENKVISLQRAFYSSYISSLDNINKLDTSNVYSMNCMFYATNYLTSLDVSNFNTSKCVDLGGMFQSTAFETIDISNFNTSNCLFLDSMFGGNKKLKTVDLSNFDTSKCIDMSDVFNGCTLLESVILPKNFNLENCEDCSLMFAGCAALSRLDFEQNFKIKTSSLNLFSSTCYQDIELNMNGNTNFSIYNGSATFNLATVWRGTDEVKISKFEIFANSLGVKNTTKTRTIKIYTDLYNSLTDAQKSLITNKGYTLSYGTS